ncbi:g6946 [Coccomyxa elongata]
MSPGVCAETGTSRFTVRYAQSSRCLAAAGSRRTTAIGDGFDDIKKVGQFIFIRHGEKTVNDDQTILASQGYIRAINLDKVFGRGNTAPGTYNTPDIIYAMNQNKVTSSRRPFDTVAPLAIKLGMDPVLGERTGDHGDGVFDAQITRDDHDKLRKNIAKHADESYKK